MQKLKYRLRFANEYRRFVLRFLLWGGGGGSGKGWNATQPQIVSTFRTIFEILFVEKLEPAFFQSLTTLIFAATVEKWSKKHQNETSEKVEGVGNGTQKNFREKKSNWKKILFIINQTNTAFDEVL